MTKDSENFILDTIIYNKDKIRYTIWFNKPIPSLAYIDTDFKTILNNYAVIIKYYSDEKLYYIFNSFLLSKLFIDLITNNNIVIPNKLNNIFYKKIYNSLLMERIEIINLIDINSLSYEIVTSIIKYNTENEIFNNNIEFYRLNSGEIHKKVNKIITKLNIDNDMLIKGVIICDIDYIIHIKEQNF